MSVDFTASQTVATALKRVTGGDVKTTPTANDSVLLVDAADANRIKTAAINDIPGFAFDLTAFRMDTVGGDIVPGVFGQRLINGSDRHLPVERHLLLIVNHEHAPVNIFANQEGNQVIYTTEDNAYRYDDPFILPFASATLFVPFLSHWMAIRLNWS